ncbi:MAG TPA: RHS repeat-associated core domain-containing protein [Chitinispirillaceae bacterium]|nr:RHS repeat-associated core domain-containing protein [Chitinispirillaceae bacterium]
MAGKLECIHGSRYSLKIALITIFAMGIFNLAVADITRTVGPDGDYSAIEDAIAALLPLQDNVILEVYVGPDGLVPSMDITNSSSFNGHTLTLKGVRAFFSSATYYLNDEIEYEVQHNTSDCKTTEYTKGTSLLSRRVITDSSSSGDQYYIKNHLGSTMFLTSGSGDEIIASFDYFPYGKKMELTLTSEDAVTQTFTEKEQDRYDDDMDVGEDGEGWYYFGARYYDADVGLWTSCDPKDQFWSLYSYTGNDFNPINGTDPDGNEYNEQGEKMYNLAKQNDFWGNELIKKYYEAGKTTTKKINVRTAKYVKVKNSVPHYTASGSSVPNKEVAPSKFDVQIANGENETVQKWVNHLGISEDEYMARVMTHEIGAHIEGHIDKAPDGQEHLNFEKQNDILFTPNTTTNEKN